MNKFARRAVPAVVLACIAVFLTATPANASWYPAQVSAIGAGATVRDCYHPVQSPSTSCGAVIYLSPGTQIFIICQRYGQSVSGTYGTSDIWDYVSVTVNGVHYEGLAADTNIYTGSNGFVAEYCQ